MRSHGARAAQQALEADGRLSLLRTRSVVPWRARTVAPHSCAGERVARSLSAIRQAASPTSYTPTN